MKRQNNIGIESVNITKNCILKSVTFGWHQSLHPVFSRVNQFAENRKKGQN